MTEEPHDDGGPIGADTNMVKAPWTPTQVRAIQAWQDAGNVHPLTCKYSIHGPLKVTAEHLWCTACGFEQTWVPWMCAETFPSDHAQPLPVLYGDPDQPPPEVMKLIDGVAEAFNKQTAERVAALVIAIRLMEMHLELATPGGAGRDSIAWTVAQRRLTVLRELLDELRREQPPQTD